MFLPFLLLFPLASSLPCPPNPTCRSASCPDDPTLQQNKPVGAIHESPAFALPLLFVSPLFIRRTKGDSLLLLLLLILFTVNRSPPLLLSVSSVVQIPSNPQDLSSAVWRVQRLCLCFCFWIAFQCNQWFAVLICGSNHPRIRRIRHSALDAESSAFATRFSLQT